MKYHQQPGNSRGKKTKMKKSKLFTILVLLIAFTATGINADSRKPVAEVMVGSWGLSWSPNVSYSRIVLSVATPGGQVITKTFAAGQVPGFDLSDLEPPVLDGSYTYELRVIPVLPVANLKRGEKLGFERKVTHDLETATQTGHFHVFGGSIVNPNLQENPSGVNAQTFTTDLIVQGSACVGVDCTSSESFGFDTIRLKENNLRIKFQDTSTSASFPTNDWMLVANDSSNGGAEKFAIEDVTNGKTPFTVEANAPNNSLYVASEGRIGVRTSTPVVDIHVKQGNSPTLRLEQDGSSGFTAQTWDIAGNETNFFIRDVTSGSKLPFRIKPGSGNDDALMIHADGRVSLGRDSISSGVQMELYDTTDTYFQTYANGSSLVKSFFGAAGTASTGYGIFGTGSSHELRLAINGNTRFTLGTDGGITMTNGGGTYNASNGQWVDGSSRAYKENIKDLSAEAAIEAVKKLNPVTFKFKIAENGDEQVGFIAEEVPELVAQKNRKGLAPMDIVAVLTKVVQEQQKTIEELKKEIKDIKKK